MRILLTTCLLLPAMGAWSQVAFQSMVVRTSDGHAHSFDVSEVDSVTFSQLGSVQGNRWYHLLENPGVADYLRDFEYDASDYTYHRIFDYRGEPYFDARQDWPYGVTLGDTTYYNLLPNKTYKLPYVSRDTTRMVTIQTLGQLRMIRAEGIDNVRDLGGWPTSDGRHLLYGKIYRGTEMNTRSDTSGSLSSHQVTEADKRLLLDELKISAELDLRSTQENPTPGVSALGSSVYYANYNISYIDINDAANQQLMVNCLRFIVAQLTFKRPIYIHCVWGADRTGVLCMLLEGLLGMSQSDLDKEYELTSFSGNTRYRNNSNYMSALSSVKQQPGATLQKKFINWWLHAGATQEEINILWREMKQ